MIYKIQITEVEETIEVFANNKRIVLTSIIGEEKDTYYSIVMDLKEAEEIQKALLLAIQDYKELNK